jgi:5-methylcytosine-specific restriction enzyme B
LGSPVFSKSQPGQLAEAGVRGLTPEGLNSKLSQEQAFDVAARVYAATSVGTATDEGELVAPGTTDEPADGESYWFAWAIWGESGDQMSRFISEGVWENGCGEEFSNLVRRIKPGDRIAIHGKSVPASNGVRERHLA